MKHITHSDFQTEVVDSNGPVLVDFFAPWCGPCKALSPVLESLATAYEGRLQVVKLDIDGEGNQELVTSLGVRNVPTLKFFKQGKSHNTIVGFAPKNKIVEAIESIINQ